MDESTLLSPQFKNKDNPAKAILEEAPTAHNNRNDNAISDEGPSPFLPDTQVQYAIDSTSLGYFKRCPRLYQYAIIERWRARGESLDLRFGLEFHQAMQDYAKSRAAGIPHDDSVFDVINELGFRTDDWRPTEDTHGKKAKYKNREFLIRSVIWYLDDHAEDSVQTYIKADGAPAVELNFKFELDWGPIQGTNNLAMRINTEEELERTGYGTTVVANQPYVLCGHIDRVVTYAGELFVNDYKTTTRTLSPSFFNQFEPDNQMTIYTLAGKVVLSAPIKGVLIDGVQIGIEVETNRSVRSFTYRTQDQLDEWLLDLRYWLGLMEQYAIQDYWPQNDTSCDKYGGCMFRKICSKSPGVREAFLKSDFEKGPQWNPLIPRE